MNIIWIYILSSIVVFIKLLIPFLILLIIEYLMCKNNMKYGLYIEFPHSIFCIGTYIIYRTMKQKTNGMKELYKTKINDL